MQVQWESQLANSVSVSRLFGTWGTTTGTRSFTLLSWPSVLALCFAVVFLVFAFVFEVHILVLLRHVIVALGFSLGLQ